jgi:hypothetical protein
MSDVITNSRGLALARAAEAMLRALGGGEVVLRCPVAPAANETNRELGLEAPVSDDFVVSPVLVRGVARVSDPCARYEFLFPPQSLAAYLADRRQTAEEFFSSLIGVVHQGRLLHVESMATETFAGAAYLYRVIAAI